MVATFTRLRPDSNRQHGAERNIGAGRHRDADAGKPEDQLVGLLTGREPRTFAHGVADIADHEQIADRGAGKADEIVRFTGHEPFGEILYVAAGAVGLRNGGLDLRGKRRLDRNLLLAGKFQEAVGEVGILGGERSVDLAGGNLRIEVARHGMIGKRDRIVLRGDQRVRLEAERNRGKRRNDHRHH